MDGFSQWQAGFSRGPPNLRPRPPPPSHGSQFSFHSNQNSGLPSQAGINAGQQQNQNNDGQQFYSNAVGGAQTPGQQQQHGYANMGQQQQQQHFGFPFQHQGSMDSFVTPPLSSHQQQYDHSLGFPSGPPKFEPNRQDMRQHPDHAREGHFINSMQAQPSNMAQSGTAFQQNFSSPPFPINPPSEMFSASGGPSSSSLDNTGRGFVNNQMSTPAFPPPISRDQEYPTPKHGLPNIPPPPLFPQIPNITGHLPFTSNVMQTTSSTPGPPLHQTPLSHSTRPSDKQIQADADKEWLSTWLKNKGLGKGRRKGPALTVPEVRQKLAEWRSLLDQLTEQKVVLTEAVGADHSTWQAEMMRAAEIKEKLAKVESMFGDEQLLTQLERKLTRIQMKRARMRRLREEAYRRRQEDEQRCQDKHQKIDKWRNNILQKDLDAKREAELKKEVDDTLSEVRRKQSEATKSMELLRSLGKLRKLRKEANERKGVKTSSETERLFECKLEDYVEMMADRSKMYAEEERMLRTVVEEEQEEERERYRQARKKKEEREARKKEARQLEMLFGPTDPLDTCDPLLPYRQYYEQGDNSVQSLIHIRREWDMYLVPDGTVGATTVPAAWVVPSEPSSEVWAGCLKDNAE
ncbi:PDCD7 [Branchiostoma lanceolatum]|uniref:PDCD7 protein n=1 Tax=Branchiostoma lanceolatum TaxID=7740 RepID=A0A8J9ZGM2_BRALA|nr:PDCD7 [Branchiostoma lanceolatum]